MISKEYIRLNRVIALTIFLISFIVYYDTMAPTVSYWDCGEFIAVSHTLGVPHPPGSPFFLLLGRIASMLPITQDIAFRVNLLSPLSSAFAVMFLYLIVVQLVANWRGKIKEYQDGLVAFGAGIIGSLTFAFTDSHWFNAVEAEVYAFSTFFTAIVVWLILKWNEVADQFGSERYILIIAYMIGLATGLHLLNLLALPFIALIIYFRKYYEPRISDGSLIGKTKSGESVFSLTQNTFDWLYNRSFWVMVFITGAVFFLIHNIIIKGMPKIAKSIGIFSTGFLILLIFIGMIWAVKNRKKLLSISLTSMVLILIGYSTYALIFIRSNQDPGIDENDPETVEAFISYLEREQYGDVGILPRRFNDIPPIHHVAGYPDGPNQEFSSAQEAKYKKYELGKQWSYFWNYQIRKMYNRYFLWQFAGRGPSKDSHLTMGANSREDGVDLTQFGLPLAFLLGVIGMLYHAQKDGKMAFSVFSLFVMTGYAIILYLNQDDPQPRERDYSYVGSFFAFSIWIGIGAAALSERIFEKVKNLELGKRFVLIVIILQIIFIPIVMANSNYHSHDRSGNFVAWDYSYNLLQSCGPNGVIFTNGDNDTFPLWYLQEVEKLRTDVAVVNLSLLNTPWYIKQWRDKRTKETQIINLSDYQIDELTSKLTQWPVDFKKYKNLKDAKKKLENDRVGDRWKATEKYEEILQKIEALKTVKVPVYGDPKNEKGYIDWIVEPTYGGQALRVQDMMILHIIDEANWNIPLYFAVTVSQQNRIGLDKYLDMQGLTFQLKSHKTESIDSDKMYENLMTDIGSTEWSTNFNHGVFYETDNLKYKNWSKDYQPGYMFRNLGNKNVFYNKQTKRLLQNYRSAYMQLAVTYYMDYQRLDRKKKQLKGNLAWLSEHGDKLLSLKTKTLDVLNKMEQNIPSFTIPIQSEELHYQVARIYGDLDDKEAMTKIMEQLISRANGKPVNRVEYANTFYQELNDTERAIDILEEMRNEFLEIESILGVKGFDKKYISKRKWNQWQKAYPEIVNSLVFIYRKNDRLMEAEIVLSDWVIRNPNDINAKEILNQLRSNEN